MATIDELWAYVGNDEVSDVVEAADEAFQRQCGVTRQQALEHDADGGTWLADWFEQLTAAAGRFEAPYRTALAGVGLGWPTNEVEGAADDHWRGLERRGFQLIDDIGEALDGWRYRTARVLLGMLWVTMNETYGYWAPGPAFPKSSIEDDWYDLKPLL